MFDIFQCQMDHLWYILSYHLRPCLTHFLCKRALTGAWEILSSSRFFCIVPSVCMRNPHLTSSNTKCVNYEVKSTTLVSRLTCWCWTLQSAIPQPSPPRPDQWIIGWRSARGLWNINIVTSISSLKWRVTREAQTWQYSLPCNLERNSASGLWTQQSVFHYLNRLLCSCWCWYPDCQRTDSPVNATQLSVLKTFFLCKIVFLQFLGQSIFKKEIGVGPWGLVRIQLWTVTGLLITQFAAVTSSETPHSPMYSGPLFSNTCHFT